MRELFKTIYYLPMRLWCCLAPLFQYLTGKAPIYGAHVYFDSDDHYDFDQTVFVSPKGFRVARVGMKPRKNEEVITGASVLTCRCAACNRKEMMWMRENKTLKDVPLMGIKP